MASSPYKKAALEAANAARAALNLPPVNKLYPGVAGDSWACAITATVIDDDLDTEKYQVTTGGSVTIKTRKRHITQYQGFLPFNAMRFVELFDDGKYRTLNVKREQLSERVRKNLHPNG